MTVADYFAANPKPLAQSGDMVRIGFGAEGRKAFCVKGDKRRRDNKLAYPVPELVTARFESGVKLVRVDERISREIAGQVRYQMRKEVQKLKQAA